MWLLYIGYKMEIKYDADVDAMYIRLRDGTFHHNKKIDDNTIINYDEEGNVLGIEILFVKENNPHLLQDISVKQVITA